MFSVWLVQPLSFMLNAFARRDAGMASKPDSTIVSFVPPGRILERERDEGRRLDGVVDSGFHCVGMPAEGEEALRIHPLDPDPHGHVLVGPQVDLSADFGAGLEGLRE